MDTQSGLEEFTAAVNDSEGVLAEELELTETCNEISERIRIGLTEAVPILPVPATRQEISAAVETYTEKFDALAADLKPLRDQLVQRARDYYFNRKHPLALEFRSMDRRRRELGLSDQQMRKCRSLQRVLCKRFETVKETKNLFAMAKGDVDSVLFQAAVYKIFAEQPHELGQWYFYENNVCWQHLNRRGKEEGVVIADRMPTLGGGSNHVIPPSVASLVFSHCDLESCVALRQVNSSWYSFYNNNETVLKSLLSKRCPWITPQCGNQLSSWADCALVFVSRLQSKKWTSCDRLPTQHQSQTPIKRILPIELTKDEKLPKDFTPLHSHSGRYCDYSCDYLHFEYANLNLTTMEYIPDDPRKEEETGDYDVISETNEEIVIDYDGLKITLPASADIESVEVNITKDIVVLEGDTTTYVFPRNNCHYKHLLLEHDHNVSAFLLGDIYVKKVPIAKGKFSYHMFNPHTKQFVQYAIKNINTKPVAAYNGLVWWLINKKSLIPTFMDLNNPDKVYIQKEKILTVARCTNSIDSDDSADDDERPEGFSREGDNRFLTGETASSAFQAIDLDSETVNYIEVPLEGGPHELVVGYVKDKFHARYVHHAIWDGYMNKAEEYKYL